MLILIVASGPDKGRVYELKDDGGAVVLGRDGDQVKLSDRKVSRQHAKLTCEGGRWYVQDLESRHGTYRNHKRLEQKGPVKDGDYLQIGRTVMVASRMQVEQAERLALLGDPPEVVDTDHLAGRRRRPSLAAAAVILAAAGVVGLNIFQYVESRQHNDDLKQRLADARTASDDSAQKLLAQMQANQPADYEPLLKQILASTNAAREQAEVLAEIKTAIAKMPQSQDVAPTLASILARLEAQPVLSPDKLATLMESLELQAAQSRPLLDQVAAAAEQARANQQTLAEIRAALNTSSQQLNQALADAAGRDADEDQQIAELRRLIEAQPTRLEALLVDRNQPDPSDNLDKLYAEVAGLRASLSTDLAQRLDRVVAQLDAQPGPEKLAAAVAQVMADHPTAISPTLEQLVERLDQQPTAEQLAVVLRDVVAEQPEGLTPTLQKLLTRLEQQPDAGQLAARLDRIDRRLDRQATPQQVAAAVTQAISAQGDAVTPALEALAAKLDDQPSADDMLAAVEKTRQDADRQLVNRLDRLAAAISGHDAPPSDASDGSVLASQESTAKLLTEILEQLKDRQPIDELRSELQALAATTVKAADDPRLTQILDAVQTRREADARLAEVAELMQAWPQQTDQRLDQILVAVQSTPGRQTDEALAAVLTELRSRDSAMEATIQEQVRKSLASTQIAFQPVITQGPVTTPANAAREAPTPAAMMSQLQPVPAAPAQPLTPVEEAYRIAFETGQPIVIGAGKVNPATGEVTEGRRLDPAAARAAGMKTWRQWYFADDVAERLRLQRAATQHLQERSADTHVIRLPASN